MWVGAVSWGYYMFKFTKENHMLRRQNEMKEDHARVADYVKGYFRGRYQLEE